MDKSNREHQGNHLVLTALLPMLRLNTGWVIFHLCDSGITWKRLACSIFKIFLPLKSHATSRQSVWAIFLQDSRVIHAIAWLILIKASCSAQTTRLHQISLVETNHLTSYSPNFRRTINSQLL